MSAYFRPDSLQDAITLLSKRQMTVVAGCTDVFPATEAQGLAGGVLDLTGIRDLRGVRKDGSSWRIGAATTWRDILEAGVPPGFDMLKQAACEVGSVQIQAAGTLGGNICNASPAADGMPPLIALDAEVEIAGPDGVRRLGLSEFVTGVRRTALNAGEIVTAIHIPDRAAQGRSRFLKLGARRYLVISIAMVAVRVQVQGELVEDIALAVGACSAVARRLGALEAQLRGIPVAEVLGAITPDRVGPALAPISDVRADAEYRAVAAADLLRRAVADVIGGPA